MAKLENGLTDRQKSLAAALLDLAASQFANNSCNDLDLGAFHFSSEEMRDFAELADKWNRSSQPEYAARENLRFAFPDWVAMRVLAARLRGEI
jgi:hypothetical protein